MLKPRIVNCKYKDKKYVILQLGVHGDKLVALVSNIMPAEEVVRAKEKFKNPGLMGLKEAATWIKENLPISYKTAYRHFKISDLERIKEYDL